MEEEHIDRSGNSGGQETETVKRNFSEKNKDKKLYKLQHGTVTWQYGTGHRVLMLSLAPTFVRVDTETEVMLFR
jgi:hypothetical protein